MLSERCRFSKTAAALFTYLIVICVLSHSAATQHHFNCSGHSPTATASRCFDHWLSRSSEFLRDLRSSTTSLTSNASVPDILNAIGKFNQFERCFFRVVFDGEKFLPPHITGTYCMPYGSHRIGITIAVFSYVLSKNPSLLAPRQPFSFFVECSEVTRPEADVAAALGLPLLATSVSPLDTFSLPMPDFHMLAGLIDLLPGYRAFLPHDIHGFGKSLSSIYSHAATPTVPWRKRKPRGIYAASCNPTFSLESPGRYLTPRASLCSLFPANNTDRLVDVFLMLGDQIAEPGKPLKPEHERPKTIRDMRAMCKLCPITHKVSRSDMGQYKYQIAMDGHGISADGTFWKLSSHSAVFLVMSDPELNAQYWQTTYLPALHPYQHYIPVHIAQLHDAIRMAVQHDGWYEAMGRRTAKLMRCSINERFVVRYTELLLQFLQRWYVGEKLARS